VNTGRSPSPRHSPLTRNAAPGTKLLRVSHLRRLRECEKVAAVCYRVRPKGIEFLLVQTRNRRWTFPKGGTEPGLTHAQAAALEAFEEAGVHGRMEEASFARYLRREREGNSTAVALAVNAHLCEVLRLDPPQEPKRNRTWFSTEETKRRLRQDRPSNYGAELARVVDRAVSRIRQLRNPRAPARDALQKVQFTVTDKPVAANGRTRRPENVRPNGRNVVRIDSF